jgi:hypothetical protein
MKNIIALLIVILAYVVFDFAFTCIHSHIIAMLVKAVGGCMFMLAGMILKDKKL